MRWIDRIGPLGVWTNFQDDWLVSRPARRLFLACALLGLLSIPVFLGWVDIAKMSFAQRLPWVILAMTATLGLLFLWLGMWRYWFRLDDSGAWNKRFWFVVLLVGFVWGGFFYFFFAYLPRVTRHSTMEPGEHG